jgi:hypothetical protein
LINNKQYRFDLNFRMSLIKWLRLLVKVVDFKPFALTAVDLNPSRYFGDSLM